MEEKTNFPATYFDRDAVLRFARLADIFAWLVLGFFLFQFLVSLTVFILQITRGLIVVNGPSDVIQQLLWFVQPIPQGLLYFVLIQAISKALLIFMDVEDNLRRAARNK